MVDSAQENPLAGARLLRTFLQGPQDLSISETASELTRRMWLPLGGTPMPGYSLDWVRVVRPASYLSHVVAQRAPLLRYVAPSAVVFDPLLSVLAEGMGRVRPPTGVTGFDATAEELAAVIPDALSHLLLRPSFDAATLCWLINHALRKERLGSPVIRIVRDSQGLPVGAYLAHCRPRGFMSVLQVFALPRQAAAVVEDMLAHAWRLGAVAVTGRNRPEAPELMDALELQRSFFLRRTFTLLQSRSPELVDAVASGRACVNGLAGETWTRICGGDFESHA
jgi:hypothetical protein